MAGTDGWEDLPPKKAEWEDLSAKKPPTATARQYSRPLPANAGLAAFGASLVGLPMDTVENIANLGIAGYGAAKTALTGKPGPDLIHGIPGGSENIKAMLRSTGAPGLSPDNPDPESKMGTA